MDSECTPGILPAAGCLNRPVATRRLSLRSFIEKNPDDLADGIRVPDEAMAGADHLF